MTVPKKAQHAALDGEEPIAAGLTAINGTIHTWAGAGSRQRRSALQECRPAGLIAIAARWMQQAIRLN